MEMEVMDRNRETRRETEREKETRCEKHRGKQEEIRERERK